MPLTTLLYNCKEKRREEREKEQRFSGAEVKDKSIVGGKLAEERKNGEEEREGEGYE